MSPILRIKLARALSGVIFWVPVIVLYFNHRGLSEIQTYSIIAFYGFAVAFLEFPTGVISDYYSQSLSLKVGYLINSLGIVALCFPLPLYLLYLAQFVSALGISLTSGSDLALMSQYSSNMKRDVKDSKIWLHISILVSSAIGAFIFPSYPTLPLLLTGGAGVLCFLLLRNVHDLERTVKYSGNIFKKAQEGIQIVMKNRVLFLVTTVSGLLVGFEMSIKYLFNSLFLSLHIGVPYHGVIFSALVILQILGISLYKSRHSKRNALSLFLIPLAIVTIGFSRFIPITLLLLAIIFIMRGINDTFLELTTVEETPSANTASVLSFKSLLQRLLGSIYAFSFGLLLAKKDIFFVFLLIGIFLCVVVLWFLLQYRRNEEPKTL
ncbi:hypothetical protein COX64_04985 [Candidatus Dojkabacteria bacterium CG_4_10_14_0_2_um_filter_Dojkabacteria_WS6_41_15]|uniref:Major facilitator superfamily (MFS) profile domain-containing protein n=1 Tax=Candidatus Dojkabacteria bacterium CG_4_10_14_0_2_um_filter_Dojkabacteria_WS6_41_15 TaxID=2014249 RepID=A0A2M7W0L7_9BACT|nr:MAG: hypothetical protein COX64_04985 [Candidatus Dojkabacteria bacterium CG_4_10_14_0_2_um_filter_Dojkabacteria_WS6_41_15]